MNDSNNINSVSDYIRLLFAVLVTPAGMFGVLVLIAALIVTLTSDRLRWFWLALALFVASFGWNSLSVNGVPRTLIFPFEQLRVVGRPLSIGLLLLIVVSSMRASRGNRFKVIAAGATAYLTLQLFLSMRLFLAGGFSRGAIGAVTYLLIFVALGVVMPHWLQSPRQAYTLLKSVLGGVALVIFGSLLQYVVNKDSALFGGRLTGTTTNPQVLGAILAFSLPSAYTVLMSSAASKSMRLWAGALAGLSVVCIVWSGSRGALLTAVLGLLVFFRQRLGQLTLTLGIVAVFAFAVTQLFSESFGNSGRFFSTLDTRSDVWRGQWAEFTSAPIFGTGSEGTGESSYLAVAAAHGVVGLVFLGTALWFMIRDCVRALRRAPGWGPSSARRRGRRDGRRDPVRFSLRRAPARHSNDLGLPALHQLLSHRDAPRPRGVPGARAMVAALPARLGTGVRPARRGRKCGRLACRSQRLRRRLLRAIPGPVGRRRPRLPLIERISAGSP